MPKSKAIWRISSLSKLVYRSLWMLKWSNLSIIVIYIQVCKQHNDLISPSSRLCSVWADSNDLILHHNQCISIWDKPLPQNDQLPWSLHISVCDDPPLLTASYLESIYLAREDSQRSDLTLESTYLSLRRPPMISSMIATFMTDSFILSITSTNIPHLNDDVVKPWHTFAPKEAGSVIEFVNDLIR